MTIERLRNVLGAIGPPATPLELAEMLWLAEQLPIGGHADQPDASDATATAGEPLDVDTDTNEPPNAGIANRSRSPVYVPGTLPGEGSDTVFIPAAPMLGRPLAIQRALRPLKRRASSRLERVVDEEATAAQIAENVRVRPWVPVLAPARERWLSLAIVIDTGPAMNVWLPLAAELQEAMARLGAFRDVRVWSVADFADKVLIRASFTGPGQPPSTLADSTGRQAVIVLSDCSGPHWWGGRVAPALCLWARHGPTAILQPLGERLWRRTAAPVVSGQASAASPGAPNTALRFTPHDGRARNRPGDVPVPVVELSAEWMADWAKLVSGSGGPWDTAVTYVHANAIPSREPLAAERDLAILDRVHRFRRVASTRAAELAAHVAVTEPYLPVMQLIQQHVLPGSRPGDLAEVLLSGLLEPVTAVAGLYRFVPGAREALLDTLSRQKSLATLDTLEQLSAEIEKRAGAAVNRFRAVIQVADPETTDISPGRRPFALASPEALRHLHPPIIKSAETSSAAVPQPTALSTAFTRERSPVHGGFGAAVPAAPYFFLSYAHTPRLDASDSTDPDLWVEALFKDLCRHIVQVTDLPRGANPGFMDKDLLPGEVWPEPLMRALATCRVFVPLYSRRYFTSADGGREWFYFNRRALNHAARVTRREEAIIPAVWSPLDLESLPAVARPIQVDYFGIEPYAQHGFWGIMKLSRYRDAYDEAVWRLAQRIVEVAERSPVREGLVAAYESLESAFGGEPDRAMPSDQRLRITVVAPQLGALPEGRDGRTYGPGARDWNPYQPDSVRPIVDHAAALARGLGYRVDIGDLVQHEADLLSGGPPSGPQVLIIDPWALMLPRYQHLLKRIDALDAPWVQVVVPWSNREAESPEIEAKLRAALDATLTRKLAEVRGTSAIAGHGIPTLDDFSMVMPKLILTVVKHYLRHAQAYPPAGPSVERPRLGGFVRGLSAPPERSDG